LNYRHEDEEIVLDKAHETSATNGYRYRQP